MNAPAGSERSFLWIAAAVFALLAAANYIPVFGGEIPFPSELVLRHAAWDGQQPADVMRRMPAIGDLITSFYPFHSLAGRAAREGDLALWNPYVLAGSPFAANSQSALFYPFNFLYYILPVAVAWAICLFVRMFLAGFFMSLFVRMIGASAAGAIVAGIVFACCGFMTAWQGQGMGDAAIWLPMICYAVCRLRYRSSMASIALAAF